MSNPCHVMKPYHCKFCSNRHSLTSHEDGQNITSSLVWFHSLTVKQYPFKILSADSTSAGAIFLFDRKLEQWKNKLFGLGLQAKLKILASTFFVV